MRLGTIVEGHGDSLALPTLVTRVANERFQRADVVMPKTPMRVTRSRFSANFDDYSKALRLLAPQCDGILVVLDSDDDDPVTLRTDLESRAQQVVGHVPVRVAPAVREYEAWLLASIPEMAGQLTLPADATYSGSVEVVRGAKGAFKKLTANRVYSETVDQKKFTAILDIAAAESRSPSFAQFVQLLGELL